MANAFTVTAAALRKTAEELRDLNSQYKAKVENLAEVEQELRSMWEGEANQAFQRAFAKDKVSLDKYYAVINVYIEALIQSAADYEKAEAQALNIINSKAAH